MSRRYILLIPHELHNALLAQALAELPNECCGLLAGTLAHDAAFVTARFPLINDAADAVREYSGEPKSIFAAHRAMREQDLVELAVYHSHPTSPAVPSRKDRADNAYGDSLMHLIISLHTGQPELRAWWLGEQEIWEGKWEFAEDR